MAAVATTTVRVRLYVEENMTRGPYESGYETRRTFVTRVTNAENHCIALLRMDVRCFRSFVAIFRNTVLLEDTIHYCVEEQVAIFLQVIAHNQRNRTIRASIRRSGATVSKYFNKVLCAVLKLQELFILPPSRDTPHHIADNPNFMPYFKDCIDVIDGTHIQATVAEDLKPRFICCKGWPSQNVLAVCDFDLKFTYVLAGGKGRHQTLGYNESTSVEKRKKNNSWNDDMDRHLIVAMQHQIAEGQKAPNGFKDVAYNGAAQELTTVLKKQITKEHIKNRLKTMKTNYRFLNTIVNLSGFGWDPQLKKISVEDQVKNDYLVRNPDHLRFFNNRWELYEEMKEVFGEDYATGEFARDRHAPSQDTQDVEGLFSSSQITSFIPSQRHQHGLSDSSPLKAPASGSKGKRKRRTSGGQLSSDMTYLSDSVRMVAEAIITTGEVHSLAELKAAVMSTSGFTMLELLRAYTYLHKNHKDGEVFLSLSEEERVAVMGDIVGLLASVAIVWGPFLGIIRSLMAKNKFYVVFKGRQVGVYDSWQYCHLQVNGFSGACFRSYGSREEAEAELTVFLHGISGPNKDRKEETNIPTPQALTSSSVTSSSSS
ncbi:uncharacterized protein LOC143880686 [Tasmannia lanceolata]|uniref:uncharacterized protein LOC143880686 n=1 Tax=Tasmannia lanceolata TaxID=3420 RepID=UPI004063B143